MDVGVVFGGRSVEHEVSIVTAHQIMAVLSERHNVVPIYIARDGRWWTGSDLNDLDVYKGEGPASVASPTSGFVAPDPSVKGIFVPGDEGESRRGGFAAIKRPGRPSGPQTLPLDVVVCAVHGTYGEDGTLQGLLELADLAYTGSGVLASAVGLDKVAMKTALRAAGLPVVHDIAIRSARFRSDPNAVLSDIESKLDYPMFVKPVRAGSSVGIGKAPDRDALRAALETAVEYDTRVLVETAMEGCIEVNCSVLGGGSHEPQPSVCEQPLGWQEFLSFQDKYMRGSKGSSKTSEGMASQDRRIPAPISDELTKQVQENAVSAFRAIGASGVARVDSFVKEETGETWVMEINTMPGSFAFYLWEETGLSFADLAERLLEIARDEHATRSALMTTFESGLLESMGGGKTGG
jgi:D-alanine-D-alanine ligase